MTDLTAWFPLWERCPELRPDGMESTPCLRSGCENDVHWGIGLCMFPVEVAAALIRDRVVVVGGEKWGFNMVWAGAFARYDRPYEWQVYSAIKHTRLSQHADPTEALRLACCSVLGIDP